MVRVMTFLVGDLLTGRISPQIGNAAVNAMGKIIKTVEVQHRYGVETANGRVLALPPA